MSTLTFSAKVTGTLNGDAVQVNGIGHVDPSLGLTDGTYEFRLPSDFDPLLLSAFLVCGYPNACATIEKTPNIFAGRSYEYRRTLKLRDGGEVSQRATIMVHEDRIESRMHLSGSAHVPKLTAVEPVVESWEPYGPGGIRGHFAIAWTTVKGFLVVGDAFSTYQVDSTHEQSGLLHRFISMRTVLHATQPRLREIQTEGLFSVLSPRLWIPDDKRREPFLKEFTQARCE